MSDNRTMINPHYNNPRRQARIDREEKELEELMKKGREPQVEEEDEEEEVQEEETQEVKEPPKKKKEEPKEDEDNDEEGLSAEEKTFKKRYGDLRRHSQKERQELLDRIEKLEKGNKEIVPPTSKEELESWIKKYPQVASIVSTIADKKAKEMFSSAEARLAKIDELQAEADKKTAEAKILEAHSDFLSIRDSDDFHDWAEQQAKWVQDALYENEDDPKSVISVLDLYKFKTGKTTADKKKVQKSAASSVKSKASEPDADVSSRKIRESAVSKMSDAEYEENEEAILAAMRNGNFIYDMTGGAR
jgi:hypothetical protein